MFSRECFQNVNNSDSNSLFFIILKLSCWGFLHLRCLKNLGAMLENEKYRSTSFGGFELNNGDHIKDSRGSG